MRKKLISLIIGIFLIAFLSNFISATVTCTPSYASVLYTQGDVVSTTINCVNNDLIDDVLLTLLNAAGKFTIDTTSIGSDSNEDIKIEFNEQAPIGLNVGQIHFDDGSQDISITLVVEEAPTLGGCNVYAFPTALPYSTVQQGETKIIPISLRVPLCYNPLGITINSVVLLSGGEKPITIGDGLLLGLYVPGESMNIPIKINSEGVSTGTYTDTLQFDITNSSGQHVSISNVPISVTVTSGIQPLTNFSLNDLPICNLNAIEMNLNQTYTLTCTRTNPNIEIEPFIDYLYIKGLSVSESSTQYIYSFEPKIIGNTFIGAKFKYKSAELGNPFLQDVRISTSGNTPISGTSLEFEFYQSGLKITKPNLVSGDVRILILDSTTHSVVNNYNLFLNGVSINNTFTIFPDIEYDLRASVPGYLDGVVNFTASKKVVLISISPLKDLYNRGDIISFSTNVENASILFNNQIISSTNYTLFNGGNFTFIAKKEGCQDGNITIKVIDSTLLISRPSDEDIKKGEKLYFEFNKETDWEIHFQKEGASVEDEDYDEIITNGTGKSLSFEMNKKGYYWLLADSQTIWSEQLEKGGMGKTGWWIIGIIGFIIMLVLIIGSLKGGGGISVPPGIGGRLSEGVVTPL